MTKRRNRMSATAIGVAARQIIASGDYPVMTDSDVAAARAHVRLSLERDAAISLLLEAPVECSERAPLPVACGRCWTCRIDRFLRNEGVRR